MRPHLCMRILHLGVRVLVCVVSVPCAQSAGMEEMEGLHPLPN